MIVPLQSVPNQSVSFPFDGSSNTVEIMTRNGGLYLTLWRDDEYVLHNRALRSYAPVGFGLILVDTQGLDDPVYEGLGERWKLMVFEDE